MDERDQQHDEPPVEDLDTTDEDAAEVKGGSQNFTEKAGPDGGSAYAFKQGWPKKWY